MQISISNIIFAVDEEPEQVNHLLISPHVAQSKILPASWRAHIDYSDYIDGVQTIKDSDNEVIIVPCLDYLKCHHTP